MHRHAHALAGLLAAFALLAAAEPVPAAAVGPPPLKRVDDALRALPDPHAAVRRRAQVRVSTRESRPACPDAAGVVTGTESWTRRLGSAATVHAALAWKGTVGDDARLRSWAHRLRVTVSLRGRGRGRRAPVRRFGLEVRRGGLDPRTAPRADGRTARWTGAGRRKKAVRRALGTIRTVAQRDLERAAADALLASERRWYDEFACVRLSAHPVPAQAVVGAATPVLVTAQAAGGDTVAGGIDVSGVARGRVDPGSGVLPFTTTFTGTEPGAGGFTATATSRRGRGRTRWDVALARAAEQAPDDEHGGFRFTQVALSAVELDGTISHYKEELPGPDDTVTTQWRTNGTMSYRTASPDPNDADDPMKWWDWDFLDPSDDQVGILKPVLYEASMSARIDRWVEDEHSVWDCSYTLPDAAKPPGLVGILSRTDAGYEVYWTLMPAQPKCPEGAPPFGFRPLPTEALVTRFKGGDVFTGESHVSRIPIDIDHRWTDGAGSHRITWKGAVYVSEPLV